MDIEIGSKWTAELRSGKWEQGKGALRSPGDKFCCLGVLCEMAVEAGVIPPHTIHRDMWAAYYAEDSAILPRAVIDWAGLNSNNGVFVDETGTELILSALNDHGMAFNELADLIDANMGEL